MLGLLKILSAMNVEDKIHHVIVLMLENRSFDHLCGYLRNGNPEIDGLLGEEFNQPNPSDPKSPKVFVSDDAPYVPDLNPSPGHDLRDVHVQLFAGGDGKTPTNKGFIYDYAQQVGVSTKQATQIMRSFAPSKVQAVATLVEQFAICDHWYSSLPGPTWPNRLFAHCATSGGYVDNNPHNFTMRTIFENLSDVQLDSWRIYYHDTPQTLMLANLRNNRYLRFFEHFDAFIRDCQNATLPKYSFIEPRYFSILGAAANDQHPDHGVLLGEKLIADVYNALRASKQWTESLLVVTWDEHGGFYDHVNPPPTVNPDDKVSPEFDFTLLGVRVPTILVSPWIKRRSVDHRLYDHSSIPATLKKLFRTADFLTKRDRQANTFEDNCSLDAARTDAPLAVTETTTGPGTAVHAAVGSALSQLRPPTDLQRSLVALVNEVVPDQQRDPTSFLTEFQAAQHVHEITLRVLSS